MGSTRLGDLRWRTEFWRKEPWVRMSRRVVLGTRRISAAGPWGLMLTGSALNTATEEEGGTEHGNDELIRVEEVRRGPRILSDLVAAVAEAK